MGSVSVMHTLLAILFLFLFLFLFSPLFSFAHLLTHTSEFIMAPVNAVSSPCPPLRHLNLATAGPAVPLFTLVARLIPNNSPNPCTLRDVDPIKSTLPPATVPSPTRLPWRSPAPHLGPKITGYSVPSRRRRRAYGPPIYAWTGEHTITVCGSHLAPAGLSTVDCLAGGMCRSSSSSWGSFSLSVSY